MFLIACGKPPKAVEDLSGHEDFSAYQVTQVRGHRDGDVLTAQASFSDGQGGAFLVDLRFAIETSARLESGKWRWIKQAGFLRTGTVAARSVMFLGGQNGAPSIGGSYDLLDEKGVAAYRVNIPTTALEERVPQVR